MNAALIEIAQLTALEISAAVELLREEDEITLDEMSQVASAMAAGSSQWAFALAELNDLLT